MKSTIMRHRIKRLIMFVFPGFFYRIPGVGSVRDVVKVRLIIIPFVPSMGCRVPTTPSTLFCRQLYPDPQLYHHRFTQSIHRFFGCPLFLVGLGGLPVFRGFSVLFSNRFFRFSFYKNRKTVITKLFTVNARNSILILKT